MAVTAEIKLRIRCGACETDYQVGSRLAGRKLRCRSCQAILEVPRQGAEPPPSASTEELGSEEAVSSEEAVWSESTLVDEFDVNASHEDLHAGADESRIALLREMGIDPDEALVAYERERDRCDGCGEHAPLEEGLGGRFCAGCQADDVVAKPQAEPEEARPELVTTPREAPDAGTLALYAGLFFLGFAGLTHTMSSLLWHPSWLVSLALALVVAGFGTHRVRLAH